MVYGLDKMVYGLPWLDKTAMKWSTGDKMVYGLPSFDKTAMGLDKRPSGAIKWSTGDKWSTGRPRALRLARCLGLIKRSARGAGRGGP